jgi:hypothetical protein
VLIAARIQEIVFPSVVGGRKTWSSSLKIVARAR